MPEMPTVPVAAEAAWLCYTKQLARRLPVAEFEQTRLPVQVAQADCGCTVQVEMHGNFTVSSWVEGRPGLPVADSWGQAIQYLDEREVRKVCDHSKTPSLLHLPCCCFPGGRALPFA